MNRTVGKCIDNADIEIYDLIMILLKDIRYALSYVSWLTLDMSILSKSSYIKLFYYKNHIILVHSCNW